jgi:ABC-type sugar transport system substrate-binding protein
MAEGAEQAIDAAGSLPNKIQIIGGGAGAYGVAAVRAGRWYATFLSLPFNEGVDAAQIGITAARGKKIKQPGIDPVVQAGYPPFMTVNNLSLFANFVPQWPG